MARTFESPTRASGQASISRPCHVRRSVRRQGGIFERAAHRDGGITPRLSATVHLSRLSPICSRLPTDSIFLHPARAVSADYDKDPTAGIAITRCLESPACPLAKWPSLRPI